MLVRERRSSTHMNLSKSLSCGLNVPLGQGAGTTTTEKPNGEGGSTTTGDGSTTTTADSPSTTQSDETPPCALALSSIKVKGQPRYIIISTSKKKIRPP